MGNQESYKVFIHAIFMTLYSYEVASKSVEVGQNSNIPKNGFKL